MTVEPHAGSAVPANPDDFADIGLEDVGVTDVVIPRIQIVHEEGVFRNNLSKETFPVLECIVLGLVKQRVFFDDDVEDGDRPKCKSPDFEHGFPNDSEETKKAKRFPWDESNFNPADFPPDKGINGLVTLPCESCIFKEWDKKGWKQPPCAEQHTYPLLYTPDGGTSWIPALFTTQKTGIKPSRQFISSFAQTKTPMFTAYTEITLTLQKRGTVTYSVPVFKRKGETERAYWGEYGTQYRSIRELIRSAPRPFDEDDSEPAAPASNENTAPEPAPEPVAAAAPAAATPAPPAPAAADNDDLPF